MDGQKVRGEMNSKPLVQKDSRACTLRLSCMEEIKDVYTVSRCFGLNTILE